MGWAERARRARREAIGKVADALAKELIDRGQLIEAGFVEMLRAGWPQGVTNEQRKQLRSEFFGGAQHLFGTITGVLDEGEEPTPDDLRRMSIRASELDVFIAEYKREHGIGDDVIVPSDQDSGARQ